MWIGSRRPSIVIYGLLLVLATQLTLVFAGCAIQPDANGHVDIPSSWKSIGEYAFSRCSSLKTVSIGNSVTTIGEDAFSRCSSLKTVSIGNSVKTIGSRAFYKCSSLETVSIGNSSFLDIGLSAFYLSNNIVNMTFGTVNNISNDERLSRPISSSDFRDSYLHCIKSMGPFEPKICVSENCEFFPSKSGVSRPNTAVGAALFCLGKSRYTSSVLELGTEKASGTRQIALGARQGRPMRITTIEGRKTQYEQTVNKWSKKFPEIDWVLGTTINTLSSQTCFQKHYQLDNTDVASNAILSSTCTSMSTLDSVFMDTTICTAMDELKTLMSECSNVWLLIAHDLDNKYKAKDIVAYTGWVEIYRHWDQFSNTDKDYCDCKANPKNRKSGRAQVGVFFNPERFSRSITYLKKEKAGNKIYQSWTI